MAIAATASQTRQRVHDKYLDDVLVGTALVRLVVLGVLEQDSVHVGAGVLGQFVGAGEENQRDLDIAQYAQLVRFLHQTELALCERHLPPAQVNSEGIDTRYNTCSYHRRSQARHTLSRDETVICGGYNYDSTTIRLLIKGH